jgi:hypothetical protein
MTDSGQGVGLLGQLGVQAVIGLGFAEARLAGRAGLIGAVGAQLGAVSVVVGGYVQGD